MIRNNIIFEIDTGIELPNTGWVKHNLDLYKITYSWKEDTRNFSYGLGAWGYGDYGSFGELELPPSPRVPVLKVGSLIIGGESFTQVFSQHDAELQDKSFYFDLIEQILYVNFPGITSPSEYTDISLGATKGYSKFPIRFEGVEYDSRITSIPGIVTARDALFFGKVRFEGGSVTLVNTDHYFDTLDQEDVFGKICRIRYSDDGGLSFTDIFTGKFQDYQLSGDEIVINIKDQRKQLLTEIPFNTFSKDTYPNMADNQVGTPIPFGFGIVKDSQAYALDNRKGRLSYDFIFCDTTFDTPTAVSKVRLDDREVEFEYSLVQGTITLDGSIYTPGGKVTVDYTGFDITNPLDIISFLLEKLLGIEYNSNFYNITNWEYIKNNIYQEIGLGIVDSQSVVDIIGKISSSIFGMFLVDGDGKYNFKIVDNTKDPVLTLYKEDFISTPVPEYKGDEYISSCKVYYTKGIVSGDGPQIINRTKEEELFTKYDFKLEKEFDTLLVTPEDAEEYSDNILNNFGGIFQTWTINTKFQAIEVEIEDIIDAYLYENYRVRLEVISKEVDYISREITFIARFVSFPDGKPPIGSKIIRR